MTTIEQLLVEGEYVIQKFEISPIPKSIGTYVLLFGILSFIIPPLALIVYLAGLTFLSNVSNVQAGITNRRIYIIKKFRNVTVQDIVLTKIESTDILQGKLGRKHDYGSIMIKGVGNAEILLHPIQNPYEVHKTISSTLSKLH